MASNNNWLKEQRREEEYKREQYGYQSKGDYLWARQGRLVGRQVNEPCHHRQDVGSSPTSSTRDADGAVECDRK